MIFSDSQDLMSHQDISIGARTIGKILKEERMRVPPSQRSYRWKTEHIQDFFQDIRAAIDGDADEYFLGSIVGIAGEGRIFIYDGQQRLATTMIMISAIRNKYAEIGNDRDADIAEREYLFSERRGGDEVEPHLILNLMDRGHFVIRIGRPAKQSTKSTSNRAKDSHKRIDAAAKFAKEYFDNLTHGQTNIEANKLLTKWLDFIDDSLRVVWVQVFDERTAFTIFETMNDRGLKLSAADLLKNFLHAAADTEDRKEEVIAKWSSMTATLETVEGEEDDIVEYIRCFWVSRYGHTRTRYLYDKIKEKTTNKAKAIALVNSLEASAQDYAAIIMSSHERTMDRGEEVRANIAALKTLGVTQLRPMLLAAFIKFAPGQFAKLLDKSLSWSVRFLVGTTPSGTIEGYYAKIAVAIWTGTTKKATDDEFYAAFANASESKEKIARYYLNALQQEENGIIPPAELTLEHIMPKKLDGHWKHIKEDEQFLYLNRIGNLALVKSEDNGRMQGKPYSFKQTVLSASTNPSLTVDAAKYPAPWDFQTITTRQKRLAEVAVRAWPIK